MPAANRARRGSGCSTPPSTRSRTWSPATPTSAPSRRRAPSRSSRPAGFAPSPYPRRRVCRDPMRRRRHGSSRRSTASSAPGAAPAGRRTSAPRRSRSGGRCWRRRPRRRNGGRSSNVISGPKWISTAPSCRNISTANAPTCALCSPSSAFSLAALEQRGYGWVCKRGRRRHVMIGRLNHVAIAVRDIAKAANVYRQTLGAQVSEPMPQPDHGVTTVFITLPNTKIELLEPLGPESPIAKFLERNPDGGIHHVCYEVSDIRAARDALKAQGARVLGDGQPKIGAHGKPVLFLHPKDFFGTLVELEQA